MTSVDARSEILPHPGLDRPDIFTGRTRLAGVVGWPVMHSRSPRLHNYWIARYGIDGAYVPLAVQPGLLEVALRGLLYSGFAGVNLTIPHKEAALAICDEHDEVAARAGAANTLTFTEDGRIFGSNTDGEGFINNVASAGVDPAAGPVLLLGAGGSSRAIAAALLAMGVPVSVTNRTEQRARALAETLPGVRVVAWEQREDALPDHALLVNTTSVGLSGGNASDPEDGAPGSPIGLDRAPSGLVVNDIVYVPLQTRLLADAAARGLRTVDGLGMLLHQAKPGFTAWFGVEPDIDADVRARIAIDIPAT
jgi:shikimate dehydrogenase